MKGYRYTGPFKRHIQDFIKLKHALGYKYLTEELALQGLDKYTFERHSPENKLTKEIVMGWCSKRTYEKQATVKSRTTVIRQFAVFLYDSGIKDVFILPKNYFAPPEKYAPYIYTGDELKRFFRAADKTPKHSYYKNRHLIIPILFRLIYSCGLRVSEAIQLKIRDVDLIKGVLHIHLAKNDNDRLVPMSDDLTKKCKVYSNIVHNMSGSNDCFFSSINKRPYAYGVVYENFRIILRNAKIPHLGRGSGPRIHDFRHTFAVNCLKKWVMEGKDLMAYLPILRVYLGHCNFNETAYYLRLTTDVFPEITSRLEKEYSEIIPVLKGGSYEETN
ncbi:MAG: tyrosine-type recombinase/integrase [Bacteroidales bacterium]|jgi:integrase/recombinase XerD|nr:tyrosine-type recombinase/integrase [Bacteroidales bacterium]